MNKEETHLDIIIVGAGLSGINAAYYVQNVLKGKKYTLLESRNSIGGTWDLFNYPGVRSDSDMYTLGFPFYPWKNPEAIADGQSILSYIKEVCNHFGFDKHIRFNHKVVNANWDSQSQQWSISVMVNGKVETKYSCDFLYMCSGYYDYDQGHQPNFPGVENFKGRFIHPQFWDKKIEYENKEVVIIGSGATAVTLGPTMAQTAKKVFMLQRSPTYIISMPTRDKIANLIKKLLPNKTAHKVNRLKNILVSMFFYNFSKYFPSKMKSMIKKGTKDYLGDLYKDEDFSPNYDPWDQRLCISPDGDFFDAIKEEKLELVTDMIDSFSQDSIKLKSGRNLRADIVVSATGLKMQLFGGMNLQIDNKDFDISKHHAFKGVLVQNLPNFAVAVGYTNASWTLKCDLNSNYVVKLIEYMDRHKYKTMVPEFDSNQYDSEQLLDLSSGYINRGKNLLPKQGNKAPWKVYQNYFKDLYTLKYTPPNHKAIKFS